MVTIFPITLKSESRDKQLSKMKCIAVLFLIFSCVFIGHCQSSSDCSPENIPNTNPESCCNLEGLMDKEIVTGCKVKFGEILRRPHDQKEHPFHTGHVSL